MRLRATTHIRNHKMLDARERLGLTQPEAAELCDISVSRYRNYENLNFPATYIENEICRISSALSIPTDDVMPKELVNVKVQNKTIKVRDVDSNKMLDYTSRSKRLFIESPSVIIEKNDTMELILKCLDKLDKKEQEIIKLRYGIMNNCHTLVETGKQIKMHPTQVAVFERRAIRKIKHHCEAHKRLSTVWEKFNIKDF